MSDLAPARVRRPLWPWAISGLVLLVVAVLVWRGVRTAATRASRSSFFHLEPNRAML